MESLWQRLQLLSEHPSGVIDWASYRDSVCLVPLLSSGLLCFQGEESQAFLQGQLSSDVRQLNGENCQLSSYSTPKGRMQATFRVWKLQADYLLELPLAMLPALQKRLSMFIMRSKTKALDVSADWGLIGVVGGAARQWVEAIAGQALQDNAVHAMPRGAILALPGNRFILQVSADRFAQFWAEIKTQGVVSPEAVWEYASILAGEPRVTPATQEAFVAQMANLELVGGVSFTKGCYPGQEIVARTQYLGKLKRRTFRAHVASDSAVPGMEVFSPEMNGQASGQLMRVSPAPEGGQEILVVAQISSLEHGLHLGGIDGPVLDMRPLPYEVA